VDDGGAVFEPDAAPDGGGAPFRPGQRVRHAKFGNGRVRALEPHGRSFRAVVEFREGRKTLDLDFTRLEPLGEGS
jgi:hypothetical protein